MKNEPNKRLFFKAKKMSTEVKKGKARLRPFLARLRPLLNEDGKDTVSKPKTAARGLKTAYIAIPEPRYKTVNKKKNNKEQKHMTWFDFFSNRRIKLIKKETAEKKKLIQVQQDLNELLREEKEIESQ